MQLDFGIVLRAWPVLLGGFAYTVVLSIVVFVTGIAGGLAVCMLRLNQHSWVTAIARTYIGLFRTIPEMVLLFWIYYCLPLLAGISVPTVATGVLALALIASAYFGEIFRTGIAAVPTSQFEAGRSLGMHRLLIWRKIVLPQALPIVSGPVVNYSADIVKNTSLLAAIGIAETMYRAMALGSKSFRYFEFVTVAGVLYFAIIFPLSLYARSRGVTAAGRRHR
ncbi:MAG: amino acid ABC transporter permease [Mesorhizobium sp.]